MSTQAQDEPEEEIRLVEVGEPLDKSSNRRGSPPVEIVKNRLDSTIDDSPDPQVTRPGLLKRIFGRCLGLC